MPKYKGQSQKDYQKNYTRINDIITKSKGDKEVARKLAKTQADRITDEHKAVNRAFVAKELGQEEVFDIFLTRAFELGSVGKQEYRDYRLEQLLNGNFEDSGEC